MFSTKIVAFSAIVAAVLAPAVAYEKFTSQMPNGGGCGKSLGHAADGGYTEYARLWKECDGWATACKKIYPGTTLTVGEVLGDPCCVWTPGSTPHYATKEPNKQGFVCQKPQPTAAPTTATPDSKTTPFPPTAKPASNTTTPCPSGAPVKPHHSKHHRNHTHHSKAPVIPVPTPCASTPVPAEVTPSPTKAQC